MSVVFCLFVFTNGLFSKWTHGALGTTFFPLCFFIQPLSTLSELRRSRETPSSAYKSLVWLGKSGQVQAGSVPMSPCSAYGFAALIRISQSSVFRRATDRPTLTEGNERNPLIHHSCILSSSDTRFGPQEPRQARTLTWVKLWLLLSNGVSQRTGFSHQSCVARIVFPGLAAHAAILRLGVWGVSINHETCRSQG